MGYNISIKEGAFMLNDEIMGRLMSNAYTASRQKPPEVRPDVSEEEALRIFNEVVEVFKSHNVSYQCACRLTMALNEAFITGAVELYEQEYGIP